MAFVQATEIHKKLFEKKDWRENDIARKVQEDKEKEMNLLLNRYNHLKSSADEEFSSPLSKPAPKTAPKPQKKKVNNFYFVTNSFSVIFFC